MENKKGFVENELYKLTLALGVGVKKLTYERRPHDGYAGDEFVVVEYYGGGQRDICVTANSLLAIARDVLKNI